MSCPLPPPPPPSPAPAQGQVPQIDPVAMIDVFDGTPPDSLRGSSLISLNVVTVLTEGSVKTASGVTLNAGDVVHSSAGGSAAPIASRCCQCHSALLSPPIRSPAEWSRDLGCVFVRAVPRL